MSPEKHVQIVWADGSRAQAHNLDDLYERWILRRNDSSSDSRAHFPNHTAAQELSGITVDLTRFDFTSPPSIDYARDWNNLIKNQTNEIDSWLSNKDVRDARGRRVDYHNYSKKRAEVIAKKAYLLACGRVVKTYMFNWEEANLNSLLESSIGQVEEEVKLLAASFQILDKVARKDRSLFSDGDMQILFLVKDYLKGKVMERNKSSKD